jgi:hypothetical protein
VSVWVIAYNSLRTSGYSNRDYWESDIDPDEGYFTSAAASEVRVLDLNFPLSQQYNDYVNTAAIANKNSIAAYQRRVREAETSLKKNKVLKAAGFSTTPVAAPQPPRAQTPDSYEDWKIKAGASYYSAVELSPAKVDKTTL